MIFITLFRFSNLIYRGNLIIFTFIVPLILLLFRNSELLSTLFGRPVTNEKYLTINLKEDSLFRNLRIMSFRKKIKDFEISNLNNSSEIIQIIDRVNKKENLNLIVINFEANKEISKELENYLINLNKKILIISNKEIKFSTVFISRTEVISGYRLVYFNNDIQYGSKYILKRVLDILLSCFAIIILSPLFLITYFYLFLLDGLILF